MDLFELLQEAGFTPAEVDELVTVIVEVESFTHENVYTKMCEIAERRADEGSELQFVDVTTFQ